MVYLQRIAQAYHQGFNSFTHIVSKTNSLEKLLRISNKAIKFYSTMLYTTGHRTPAGLPRLSLQIRGSLELLSSIQSLSLIQQLTCPNRHGVYFFSRVSWQRAASKVFFLCYSILSTLKLAEKLKFIDLGKITQVAIEHLPVFRLTTTTLYTFSCVCDVAEAIRIHNWCKVVTSVGKIFVTTLTFLLEILYIQRVLYVLVLTGISCIIDIAGLARNMEAL